MGWLLGALGIGGLGAAALIFIPGAAANALKALSALLDLIRHNPALAAIIALSVALAGVWWVKGGQVDAANRKTAAAWAVVAEYKEAQAKAVAWALAEKRAKETAANDITKGANDARSISHTAGNRAGADYRLSHQCLRVTPAEGDRQRTDLPRSNSVAGQFAPEARDAFVAVSDPDFNACTVNSLDLDNAYAWGQKMIAAGLAK